MTPALLALVTAALLVWLTWKYADLERQRRAQHTLDRLMGPRAQALADEILMIVEENQYLLGRQHERALEKQRVGDLEEAARRMRQGCDMIEDLAPDFLAALGELRRLARTLSLVAALPPVRASFFRAAELRGLAGLGTLVHHALASGRRRMLWRLLVLRSAFRLALHFLRRAVLRLPREERAWTRVDTLVSDLHTCGDEALATARRILTALDDDHLVHMRSDLPGADGTPEPAPPRS